MMKLINSYTAIHQAFSADIFLSMYCCETSNNFIKVLLVKSNDQSILPCSSSKAFSISNVCVCVVHVYMGMRVS